MIHVFLVSAYPTEDDVRQAVSTMADGTPYLGVWKAPTPERPAVHVFSRHTLDELRAAGWTFVEPAEKSSHGC